MSTLQAANITQVKAYVQDCLAQNKRPFLYIFGSRDSTTGKSWCPDCVRSDASVIPAIAKVSNAVLIQVPTGDRSIDPNNQYKIDADIKMTRVPTLFEWSKNGPLKRLVEDECWDEAKLQDILK